MFLVKTVVCTDPFWAESDQKLSQATVIEGNEAELRIRMQEMYNENVNNLIDADRDVAEESFCYPEENHAIIYTETAVITFNIVEKSL